MKKNIKLFSFIKFGKLEHIKNFQESGKIYMNTVKYFKELENDIERKDEYEGVEKLEQINWIKFIIDENTSIESSKKNNTLISGQYYIKPEYHLGNLFCLTAITDQFTEQNNRLDPKMKDFGDTFLIINDTTKFLTRLNSKLKEINLNYKYDLVSYYDRNSYNGELNILHKSNIFEHQNEWRLNIETLSEEPFEFEIGSIEDISILIPSSKIDELTFEIEGFHED
jgi:hypothetical protein